MVTTEDQRAGRLRMYLSLACCNAALVLIFLRFIEFDAPLTRFVRSLNDHYFDNRLSNPWLANLSDIGNQVGSGESLLAVSIMLLVAGYVFRRASFKRAGWDTLLAHAVAGGVNTAIKHVVGRGRPKFMHTDHFEFVPFGGKGWDSFPSGHSMAAFAVATVLAVRFPKARWILIVTALAVSASRLFRASHFLSDIVGGAVFGVLIGMVVAHPWKDWRASLTSALFMVTPPMAALLAVMTAIGQSPLEGVIDTVLCRGGLLLALTALLAYVLIRVRPDMIPAHVTIIRAMALMGVGIAMCSGSMWVTTVIVLVYLSHWLRMGNTTQLAKPVPHPIWPYEAAFGLTVLLTLYAMLELRGVLPMG
jgi:membrane-associated phospholipid phosphatase